VGSEMCIRDSHGTEKGRTPAGIPVRNVAQPVIRHAYNVYRLDAEREVAQAAAGGAI